MGRDEKEGRKVLGYNELDVIVDGGSEKRSGLHCFTLGLQDGDETGKIGWGGFT